MQNLYEFLINDQEDLDNDVYLEILNDMHGHLDFDELSKYHDLHSYDNLTKNCTNHLKIIHINARSLSGKIDLISALLGSLQRRPDILCISETWLQSSDIDTCNIAGYYAYHVFRGHRSHGGVSMFVSDHLNSIQLLEHSYIHDEIEINSVDVHVSNKTYTICGIYRPHFKHNRVDCFSEKLSEILLSNDLRGKQIILMGDFNINLLELDTHPPTHNFLTHIQSLNYFTHISRPTRFPDGLQAGDPSLLDHIYTNFFLPFKSGILLHDISDHLPVFIHIPLPLSNVTHSESENRTFTKEFRVFSEHNKNKFTECLSIIDWNDLLINRDVNNSTQSFLDTLLTVFDNCFPLKSKEISEKRAKNPWITSGVLRSIRTKNKLFKDFKLGFITRNEYNIYRNHLNATIRTAKRDYYLNYFEKYKDNVRKIWKKINEFKKAKSNKNTQKINLGSSLSTNNYHIANAFNQFFTNIGPSLDSKIPNSDKDPLSYLSGDYPDSMAFTEITTDDIVASIISLKDKNDRFIPTSLIKSNARNLALPLSIIFNRSVTNGIFPDEFKKAVVCPLYKKGPKSEIGNYRPISLLSTFSKLFESIMKKYLMNYLISKSILSEHQFGFQKGLSTFDALNKLTSDLYKVLDKRKAAICIFIDFQKAFDTVNHKLLLKKMHFYGIRGHILDWFESYLSDRKQSVLYNNVLSESLNITHGVPQGSVLGPVLFLLYINDLSKIFSDLNVLLFADDSSLYLIGDDLKSMIIQTNTELDRFYDWVLCNRLSVHLDKTKYIIVTNKKYSQLPPLFINFDMIQQTEFHKALGVTLDSKLSFKYHIDDVCQKLSRSASLFHNLKDLAPINILIGLYYAHAHSHLSYCLALFGSTYPTHLQNLFVLQKKIIRLVTNQPPFSHTNDLFKQTKIPKFFDMVKLEIASYMFKNKNNGIFRTLIHGYETRFRENLVTPNHVLSIFEKSLEYNGPRIWNSIPVEIKNKRTPKSFRRSFKSLLVTRY